MAKHGQGWLERTVPSGKVQGSKRLHRKVVITPGYYSKTVCAVIVLSPFRFFFWLSQRGKCQCEQTCYN